MTALADYLNRLDSVIQDQATLLSSADRTLAVRSALEQYSRDVPYERVHDDTDGDSSTYDLDLPSDYQDGFSRIVSVEYPAGARLPVYLDRDDWTLYRTAADVKLRLLHHTPSAGETVRITYTTMHVIEDLDGATATTVPAHHDDAFVWLAGAKALYLLADRFLQEQENTLGLDTVDRDGRTDQARRMAGALLGDYQRIVGVTRGMTPATSRIDWDTTLSNSGVRLLTHGRRRY